MSIVTNEGPISAFVRKLRRLIGDVGSIFASPMDGRPGTSAAGASPVVPVSRPPSLPRFAALHFAVDKCAACGTQTVVVEVGLISGWLCDPCMRRSWGFRGALPASQAMVHAWFAQAFQSFWALGGPSYAGQRLNIPLQCWTLAELLVVSDRLFRRGPAFQTWGGPPPSGEAGPGEADHAGEANPPEAGEAAVVDALEVWARECFGAASWEEVKRQAEEARGE